MLAVFSAAILLSAALLFTLQPMVAKLLLPLLGGSPSVWNTCMLFFQAGLLAGYGYAHLLATKLPPRVQLAVHAGVLVLSGLALPIAVRGGEPSGEGSPVAWLLGALALSAGLPFFAVSTTGPLLQRWFSRTDHPEAHDPYFLYAASNIGSLGGLLAYPFVIEPWLPLRTGWLAQTSLWSAGYFAFGALVIGAGWLALRHPSSAGAERGRSAPHAIAASVRSVDPGWRRRLFWLVLAFVPSSLLLGTTQYLTTDIAAIPFLWVVPLVLYLATFVVAFARQRPSWLVKGSGIALAIGAVLTAVTMFSGIEVPTAMVMGLTLLTLTCAGLVAHGRLADTRPAPDRLTEFYFFVALGGVLGGAFNAIAAPLLFNEVWEYPLALALACALRASWKDEPSQSRSVRELLLDIAATVVVGAVVYAAIRSDDFESLGSAASSWVLAGIPALLVLSTMRRARRFALCCAALLAGAWIGDPAYDSTIYRERTFFGVHQVSDRTSDKFSNDADSGLVFQIDFHVLTHGTTKHGMQALDPRLSRVPSTYFHPTGPAGQIFAVARDHQPTLKVGLIGLGAGTLAAYGHEGDHFTIYDIDPAVVRIARDPRFFTYIRDSAATFDYVIGDGRLSLEKAPPGSFDLIIVDAFSSDSIPVHLLTREAIRMYLSKLAPGGFLTIHISNQYIELAPVVGAIAQAEGVRALHRFDDVDDDQQELQGKEASHWAVVDPDHVLSALDNDPRWELIHSSAPPWTDDFSNVWRAFSASSLLSI